MGPQNQNCTLKFSSYGSSKGNEKWPKSQITRQKIGGGGGG